MQCFFIFVSRYVEVMLFSKKMKTYIVFILSLGGQHVAISLVLAMFLEMNVFSQVRFQ